MKPKASKWSGQAAGYAHLKLDGHFLEVNVEEAWEAPVAFFYTSHPTDISSQMPQSLVERVMDKCVPGDKFYAELFVHGEKASYVKTALKESDERLDFRPFATPCLPVEASLEDVEAWFERRGLSFAPYVVLEAGWHPDALLEQATLQEAEGYMLKDGNLLNWRKLKREPTIDLVVTGLVDGKGKHEGLVGSLVCSAYRPKRNDYSQLADFIITGKARPPVNTLIEVCRAGGMSDDERWEMGEATIGKVVEIAYQHVDSRGRLRHPRFVRFRDDKSPLECTLEQDEDLLNAHR